MADDWVALSATTIETLAERLIEDSGLSWPNEDQGMNAVHCTGLLKIWLLNHWAMKT